ncbi:hypothetical protein M408DRAFT_289390 [Serendipita vermifera MAFF 305830]|uniref:Uncharacterized protein n=1 Tax=Serendipita vermifera MAFF 305830 TaxID=933852 RepID=A0A0C3BGU4_SERVB|nr:hypothetical protein M408DRAFT_289390 [Serendipita vermifera MAFF 305830]
MKLSISLSTVLLILPALATAFSVPRGLNGDVYMVCISKTFLLVNSDVTFSCDGSLGTTLASSVAKVASDKVASDRAGTGEEIITTIMVLSKTIMLTKAKSLAVPPPRRPVSRTLPPNHAPRRRQ